MEQIIIRDRFITALHSKAAALGYSGSTIRASDLPEAEHILKELFCEGPSGCKYLLDTFDRFISGEGSEGFLRVGMLAADFGASVGQHIYLYHADPSPVWFEYGGRRWAYMSGKRYIGDPWWFSDKEIYSDLNTLSMTEFLRKYKGF